MSWYLDVLKKYAVFSGRATRSEYWYFTLFNLIVIVVLVIIDSAAGTNPLFSGVYTLAVFLPILGVSIRRLHDTGRSGWWILVGLIPVVGSIALIVFYALDSAPGENVYGPSPKAPAFAG